MSEHMKSIDGSSLLCTQLYGCISETAGRRHKRTNHEVKDLYTRQEISNSDHTDIFSASFHAYMNNYMKPPLAIDTLELALCMLVARNTLLLKVPDFRLL
jgi:hypothetical protein